jgi:hypothetical protein
VLGQCIESHIGEHYQELILVKLMSVHYSNEPDIGLKQLIFLRCAIRTRKTTVSALFSSILFGLFDIHWGKADVESSKNVLSIKLFL